MRYESLYIVGNGFDLHHKIRSNFPEFKEWIKKNDYHFFNKLTQLYDNTWDNTWWRDFENSLAKLNINYYANWKGNEFDPEYIKEGSIEEKTQLASMKIKEEFDKIKDSLKVDFQKWLLEAYKKCEKDQKIKFHSKSIYLTFNYTKVLEEIYKIEAKHVYHIHGVIDDKDSMIIGHGLSKVELNDILEGQESKTGEVLIKKLNFETQLQIVQPEHKKLATSSSLESIASLKKDVEKCIEKHKKFFNEITEVQTIYVYGFSFSPIDMPYLEKIIRRTKTNTHWVFSWHSQEDKRRIMDFVIKYEIQNITMINEIKTINIQ